MNGMDSGGQLEGVQINPQSQSYGSIAENDGKFAARTKHQSSLCQYITDPQHLPFHCIFLLLLCYVYFASYVCMENQGGLEDTIIKVMNIDTTQYSLLLFMYSWPNVIFCLIGGVIVDRVLGHRLSLILVVALTTLGQFLMALGAFLGHFWLMLVGRILIGIGNEMADIVCVALASKKKNATFRLSVYYTAAKLGGSTSLAVPQFIYNSLRFLSNPHYRLGTTLLVGVGLMIVAMAVTIIIAFMDIQEDKILKKDKRKMTMIPQCRDIKKFSFSFWISVFLIGIYCGLIIVYTTVGQDFYTKKYGLTPSASGTANSLVFFSTILVTPFVGYLINSTGNHTSWAILGMFAVFAAHLTLLLSFNESYIPYLASTIYSISYTITMPSLYAIPCLVVDPTQTATAYGFVHCSYNFVVTVMSIVTGTLIDTAGYFWMEIVFSLLIYFNVIMSIVLWLIWNIARKSAKP